MKEFEMRFKADNKNKIKEDIESLDFKKRASFQMSDLIFESREWVPGQGLKPGYFIVRLRLTTHEKPKLELKQMIDADTWEEISLFADHPRNLVKMLSIILRPVRVISKNREEYENGSLIISFDDVKHLGKFIEIEGPRNEVNKIIKKLRFDTSEKQPVYGSTLFYLEREGKIKFKLKDMDNELKRFNL